MENICKQLQCKKIKHTYTTHSYIYNFSGASYDVHVVLVAAGKYKVHKNVSLVLSPFCIKVISKSRENFTCIAPYYCDLII